MMEGLQPYPEYKDSGVEWLGKIPDNWNINPGFTVFKEKHIMNKGNQESQVLSLSYGRIIIKPVHKQHGLVPESYETHQIVDPGDVILRVTDLQNDHVSLRAGLVRDRGIISAAYLCLQSKQHILAEYLFFYFRTLELNKEFYSLGSGLRQTVDFSHLKRYPIIVPPLKDQSLIVNFLNNYIKLVDNYVLKKKKQISLLNEQKHAIIHKAVTSGFDSSNSIISDDLTHNITPIINPCKKLSKIAKIIDCLHQTPVYTEDGYPMVRISDINGSDLKLSKCKSVSESDYINFSKIHQPKKGDIIISRVGTIGEVSIVVTEEPFCLGQNTAFIIPQKCHEYIFFALKSILIKEQINDAVVGSTLQTLSLQDIKNLKIPYYSESENNTISDNLSYNLNIMGDLIQKLNGAINFIQEYRNRLLTDIVTGKLDVRSIAATFPDVEDIPLNIPTEEELKGE